MNLFPHHHQPFLRPSSLLFNIESALQMLNKETTELKRGKDKGSKNEMQSLNASRDAGHFFLPGKIKTLNLCWNKRKRTERFMDQLFLGTSAPLEGRMRYLLRTLCKCAR